MSPRSAAAGLVLLVLLGAAVLALLGDRSRPGSGAPAGAGRAAGAAVTAGVLCREGGRADCDPPGRSEAELAIRLNADPAARPGTAAARRETALGPGAERAGLLAARRLQRRLCPSVNRRETCNLAVASAAIRRLYGEVRRSPQFRRKAEVLLRVGARLGMTGGEVTNAVRAEVDTRLARAVRVGALSERRYRLALACFDDEQGCDLAALRG